MRSWFSKILVFSLVVLFFVVLLFVNDVFNYYNLLLRVPMLENIRSSTSDSFETKLLDIKNYFVGDEDLSDIDSLDLIIDPDVFYDVMNEDLPISGREEYREAEISVNGEDPMDVWIRQRGDTQQHWLFRKKSLRIRLEDKDSMDLFGNNNIELIAPKTIPFIDDYLSMLISEKLGLIAPRYRFVNFFVNGKFEGLYEVTEKVSTEEFLKDRGLPVAGIFEAENIFFSRQDGIDTSVFSNPFLWESGIDDEKGDEHFYKLYELLIALSEEDLPSVHSLVDLDYFARIGAFLYFNQTMHYDNMHNLKLYYNDDVGAFQQVIWDPLYLSWYISGTDPRFLVGNDLYAFLYRDPRFVNEVYKVVYDLVEEGFMDVVGSTIDEVHDEIFASREHDLFPLFSMSEWEASLLVMKEAVDSMARFSERFSDPGICFSSEGSNLEIVLSGEAAFYLEDIRGGGENIETGQLLFPGRKLNDGSWDNTKYLTPSALAYAYNANNPTWIRSISFKNSITGEEVVIDRSEECEYEESEYSFHPWEMGEDKYREEKVVEIRENYPSFEYTSSQIVVPSGKHEIGKDIIIPEGIDLVIRSGAILEMLPGISILSKGRVIANGTRDHPVKVVAKESGKPFGVFALYNEGAEGSRFDYFEIDGGSEAFVGGRYFSGMFSAYYVDDLIVNHSEFSHANADDALNFKFSNSEVRDSYFYNNSADAIDYDFMSGEITGNKFEHNGNDSIDTSGSTTLIQNNYIYESGDKCISLGEKTTSVVFNNLLDGCHIGIEVKDSSTPVILNNAILNNDIGINSYQKKKLFGGAHAEIFNVLLYGNEEDITFENTFKGKKLKTDDSTISVSYSNIAGGYEGEGNVDSELEGGELWIDGEGNIDVIRDVFPGYGGLARIGVLEEGKIDYK